MKHLHSFARRAAALLLAAVLCVCIPAAAASAATTIGGADTTLIPAEDENCLSWLFGSKDLTAGGAPVEVIRQYIETQGEKKH